MAAELVPQIVYGAVLLFTLGAIAALWNRMGHILRDIGRLDSEVGANRTGLNEKTDALQTSLNEKTDALQASMNELSKTVADMQLQMQRNHYQLMMAILSHSHRSDGRPTFDLPPDFDPTPGDTVE
jgi:hypothetical protein